MSKKRRGRSTTKVELIRQAILSAETSLQLARKLLREFGEAGAPVFSPKEIPGIVGTFDGNFMVTKEGKKYQVPVNYASKTKLVCGDKIKMIEEEGIPRFKQIERIERLKEEGVLAKKDGKWVVVTGDGSYLILPVSVQHHNGKEGDRFEVLLPRDNKHAPYATLDAKIGQKEEEKEEEVEKEVVKSVEIKKKDEKKGTEEKDKRQEEAVKEKKEKERPKAREKKKRGSFSEAKREGPGEKKQEKKQEEKPAEKREEKIEPILEEEDLR